MDDKLEHILVALFVAIPPTVASIASVFLALLAYLQARSNATALRRVETNTDGLATTAIANAKDAGRSEGIKEELLRKSIVPPTTPGFP